MAYPKLFRPVSCALAIASLAQAPAILAQELPPENPADALDPGSPFEAMEDIGVAWPDMATDVETKAQDPANPESDVSAERRYSVAFEGLNKFDNSRFKERFDALSVLKAGQSKPANIAQIGRRAREDVDLIDSILRAEGYYDAVVGTRVEPDSKGDLTVLITIEPGALYRFTDVQVVGLESAGDKAKELRDAMAVDARDPVDADDVLASETSLKDLLAREGFPFATVNLGEVVIDHTSRSGNLIVNVDPGGAQRFGAITVAGDRSPFGANHVGRIARFKPGEPYDAGRIDDLKRAIIATGLVSSVKVEPVRSPTPGVVDMNVTVERAQMRTLAGEFGYGTGEGLRAEASWTHRNLLPPEGAVTVRGVLGTLEQAGGIILRRSNFRERDQVLNARFGYANVNRQAYKARTFELGAGIEKQTNIIWQKKWTWSAGVELLATNERDVVVGPAARKNYKIGALPLSLNYDGSDDLLDPTSGFRLGARISPELSMQSGTFGYVRGQLDGSAYVPAGKSIVMAGRVRLGTLIGTEQDRVAPSRRFYSGGGGSVRGYGFQSIGPRDVQNDPVGGRSLAEFSLEARIRLKPYGGAFSVVPFLDGGTISENRVPNLSTMRFGAGLGMRYHSSFGPIRIDVGTPINGQKGDPRITVFVSLGQAF